MQFQNLKSNVVRIKFLILILTILLNFQVNSQTNKQRVVMISLDGTPDYLIDKYLANGVLPANGAFSRMKKNGAFATTLLPINVASTGPSHISIFTGASPAKTGIVGNSFRKSDQDWNSPSLSAFNQPIPVETIFQAAMRQGKKVIALGGVGLDYSNDNRKTDYMLMYPEISGPSLVLDLEMSDTLINLNDNESFVKLKIAKNSPSKAVFEIKNNFKIPLHFFLKNLDFEPIISRQNTEIFIDLDSDINNGYNTSVVSDNWAPMEIERDGKKYNTSFKIVKSDEKIEKFQLFMTAPAEVYGYPNGFLQKLQSSCGFWPGEPENRKQTTGLISEELWFEQLNRLSKYSKDLILNAIKENEWDLLFGYFSTLDDVQHRYTLTNPRQIDFTADNGKRPEIYAKYVEKQFQSIDSHLLDIMNALPKDTNLVIFSDHGMVPIHTVLLLNNYLKNAGFNDDGNKIKSISSGVSSHLYINKKQMNKKYYDEYLNMLSSNLKSLKDKETGEFIFELVANQQQQKEYGLFNKDYSGDLFVSCKSGYTITDRILPNVDYLVHNSFDPKMFENEDKETKNFLLSGTMNETGRGTHGCLSTLREGQSIFYAIGPDVPKKEIKEMYSLQIAATIAKLLGIKSPVNSEMKSGF